MKKLKVLLYLKPTKAGGRTNPILNGYRPSFKMGFKNSDCVIDLSKVLHPGEKTLTTLTITHSNLLPYLVKEMTFDIAEGTKVIGSGIIQEVIS